MKVFKRWCSLSRISEKVLKMSEGSFVQGDEVPRFSMNHERCFSEEARLAKPGSQNLKLYLFNNK